MPRDPSNPVSFRRVGGGAELSEYCLFAEAPVAAIKLKRVAEKIAKRGTSASAEMGWVTSGRIVSMNL